MRHLIVLVLALFLLITPGLALLSDIADPAMQGPGIPRRARVIHQTITPRIEAWAEARIDEERAASAPLHDVPTTEWPMFTAVFYLMGTEALQRDWERTHEGEAPRVFAREAIAASRNLILDPSHHTWVRTHWGEDYMHEENVFFRSLLIAGLTSYTNITHDDASLPLLRDQVETLAAELDASPLGVLNDYPGECYPIDVLAAIGLMQRADQTLGTDHSAFFQRIRRGFEGPMRDRLGLVPFRMLLPSGEHVQPGRGIGMSWVLLFTPDLWPDFNAEWYGTFEREFYEEHALLSGFREYARGTESEWTFEIDAGPVVDGFGSAASAFGIAAARRNGRFDHAYALSTEVSAASFIMVDGTMLLPRAFSHAADAPHLGEAALMYFLTVQPREDAVIVGPTNLPGLVWFGLLVFLGLPVGYVAFALRHRRSAKPASPVTGGAALGE
jgi:hypothetical protein